MKPPTWLVPVRASRTLSSAKLAFSLGMIVSHLHDIFPDQVAYPGKGTNAGNVVGGNGSKVLERKPHGE